MTPTLTCDHCESEIDVAKDPRCIQQGGMVVMCERCREIAFERWQASVMPGSPIEACRIKRGWSA